MYSHFLWTAARLFRMACCCLHTLLIANFPKPSPWPRKQGKMNFSRKVKKTKIAQPTHPMKENRRVILCLECVRAAWPSRQPPDGYTTQLTRPKHKGCRAPDVLMIVFLVHLLSRAERAVASRVSRSLYSSAIVLASSLDSWSGVQLVCLCLPLRV